MGLAEDITLLEKKLIQLKTDYEQYFMGMQKRAPEALRTEVDRLNRNLSGQRITNTALNFRLTTVSAKYNSLKTYWDRTIREIEEGRYVRDRFKMKLHDKIRSEDLGVKPPPPPQGKQPASEDDSVKKLYQEYAEARKKTNEPQVKFESLAEMIKKQTPLIKEKYNVNSVEFKVVVEDGKTKLKAVPKK